MPATPANEDLFRAIADPNRRQILDRLKEGECDVSGLVGVLGLSQPAVSQHLRILLGVGLVHARKEGRRRIYRADPAPLLAIYEWVSQYEQFWLSRLSALESFLKEDPYVSQD